MTINWPEFFVMLLVGFSAQLADGALGMGYGTISTTALLARGVNPALVSSLVHTARVFSSGVSGVAHHRFRNVNPKLFRTLVFPGVAGAITGAALAWFGQRYAIYTRLPLCLYTAWLGFHILRKAAIRKAGVSLNKVRRAGWLAGIGGFLDAFAGGGWGTLVTGTLVSRRRHIRYVIGSVCLAEFFVVLASSLTFFILLRRIALGEIAALILGGIIAAPLAARLAGRLPQRPMYIIIGSMIILTSAFTLRTAIAQLFA